MVKQDAMLERRGYQALSLEQKAKKEDLLAYSYGISKDPVTGDQIYKLQYRPYRTRTSHYGEFNQFYFSSFYLFGLSLKDLFIEAYKAYN